MKTTDAGRTWRVQKSITGHSGIGAFEQVSCPTAMCCYVLGTGSRLGGQWATADGGKHWARRQMPDGTYWYAIDFPTETSGWAVGSNGAMATTTAAGTMWHYVDPGTWEDLRSISFCSQQLGSQ